MSRMVGEHLGDLGLADARLSFQQERLAQLEGQVQGRRKAAIGYVVLTAERGLQLVHRLERPASMIRSKSLARCTQRCVLRECGQAARDSLFKCKYRRDSVGLATPFPTVGYSYLAFGGAGHRPYQSNGSGLRFTTTFLTCV